MSEKTDSMLNSDHSDLLHELKINRYFNAAIMLVLAGSLLIGLFWYFFVSDFRDKLNALTHREVTFLKRTDTLKDRISLYRTTLLVASLKKGEDYGDMQQIPRLHDELGILLKELREEAKRAHRSDLFPLLEEIKAYLDHMHVFGMMMPKEYKTDYFEALDSLAAIDANNQKLLQGIDQLQSELYSSFYQLESKVNRQMSLLIYGSVSALIVLFVVVFYLVRQMTRSTQINAVMERRIEQELEKSREKDKLLMDQSRQAAMADLLSNIAHHWRQPLNSVSLSVNHIVDLYMHDELEDEEMQHFEELVNKQLQMLSHTIDVFQKMSAPDQPRRYFKLNQIFEELQFYFEPMLLQNSIHLTVEGDAELFGSPADLLQVLVHMVNNAQDAILQRKNEQPDLSGEVHIRATHIDSMIRIVFTDNGTGVSENIAEDIFNPYFTTKFKKQGVGVSLYLDKQIIEEKFGGRIYLDRDFQAGAGFIVELPLRAKD